MTFTVFSNSVRMPAGWHHHLAAALAAWRGKSGYSRPPDGPDGHIRLNSLSDTPRRLTPLKRDSL